MNSPVCWNCRILSFDLQFITLGQLSFLKRLWIRKIMKVGEWQFLGILKIVPVRYNKPWRLPVRMKSWLSNRNRRIWRPTRKRWGTSAWTLAVCWLICWWGTHFDFNVGEVNGELFLVSWHVCMWHMLVLVQISNANEWKAMERLLYRAQVDRNV